MEHEKYKEQLILYSYNELKKEERNAFERHLLSCETCVLELEKLTKLHQLVRTKLVEEIDEDALFESRQELLAQIRNLKRKKFNFQKIWDIFSVPSPAHLKLAYSFSTAVIVIAAGYFFLLNSGRNQIQPGKDLISANSKITNLQFIDSDIEKGEVEITYEKIVPAKLKGNVNDIEIQRVLAKSLLNSENPGVRLKAVNAIYSEKLSTSSAVVNGALINAMMYDNNPGVRKEAMNALCNLPFDEKISDAMIYVLQNDKNSGLRIQAINCLDEKNDLKRLADPNIKNVLKNRMQEDDNSYIKLRAKTILTKLES